MIAGLGAVAIAGSVYLALDLGGSPPPEPTPSAAVSAAPGTSNPVLGREALPEPEPAPAALATAENAAGSVAGQDWGKAREEVDASIWEATSQAVAMLSTSGGWTDEERSEVLEALEWRHEQMIAFRQAMQTGELDPREGRQALVEVANKARATVIVAVGAERAKALDKALTESSVGAGL